VSVAPSPAAGESTGPQPVDRALPGRRARRRILIGVVLVGVAAAAVGVLVLDPFGGGAPNGGVADNAASTSLALVTRRSLSSQTQVSATLGYAGS
jgi:hypothetical protein